MKKTLYQILNFTVVASCSLPVQAAGFDCTKASSGMERRICANNELSELDQQLNNEYKAALRAAKSPSELRQSQIEWIEKQRSRCDEPGMNDPTIDYCLKPIYRNRITELRSLRTPLNQVFGVYKNRNLKCFLVPDPKDPQNRNIDMCEGFDEDRISVRKNETGAIAVDMQVFASNGHVCTFEGMAEWKQSRLVVQDDDRAEPCTFELLSDGHRIFTANVRGACSRHCGARGSLTGVEASKQ
jgi:uncharacterized protein